MPYDISGGLHDGRDAGCLGNRTFGMWDVWDEEYSGYGMLEMWDIWVKCLGLGCWGCRMFGM